MQSFKSHLSLILAITAILISIFIFKTFQKILDDYKKSIVDNYSIIIVSTQKLKTLNIPNSYLIPIDLKDYLAKMKEKYKNINFENITLPYFYKLKIKTLLSPKEIEKLKYRLLSKPYIKRVLTHSTSQTKIYNLLTIINIITKTFMILIAILGFLMIVKQLEVWKLMHSERMYIMELFGAPFWFRGASLFKIALFDSIIAILITSALIFAITHSPLFNTVLKELNITFHINYLKEIAKLLAISLAISLISTIIVVASNK